MWRSIRGESECMRCTVCLVGVIIQVLLRVWWVREATIWRRAARRIIANRMAGSIAVVYQWKRFYDTAGSHLVVPVGCRRINRILSNGYYPFKTTNWQSNGQAMRPGKRNKHFADFSLCYKLVSLSNVNPCNWLLLQSERSPIHNVKAK